MKMINIEKWSMNRLKHEKRVINITEKLLHYANAKERQNFLEVGCGSRTVKITNSKLLQSSLSEE
ncbi:MAG: hypothetical protein B6D58_06270 [candidate division Zixibacteria bacterium 4484_95]|nr:MAG: hypothetical protein B6D58_06270 [candidate division Zixibacteria bacterium 4484_95]RKX18266.1 MAG: hypothetical protein DRP26_05520 [candidate division Zixibacteria bacterium]